MRLGEEDSSGEGREVRLEGSLGEGGGELGRGERGGNELWRGEEVSYGERRR